MEKLNFLTCSILILVCSMSTTFAQDTDLQSKVDKLKKKLEALEARLEVVDQRFVNLEAVDETGEINPKAKNAEFLDRLDSAQFLRSDGKAVDADELDGLDSSKFLRSNGKAVDADKLDGINSSYFVRNDASAIAVKATEFKLGYGISNVGSDSRQRALKKGNPGHAHYDLLSINYDGDFEQGVEIWGPTKFHGEMVGKVVRSSDAALKKEIKQIEDPIDVVQKIKGISFKWNENYDAKKRFIPNQKQYGFIAQEVEKILPDIVQKNENGYKSIDYNALIPFLLESIKEQQYQIDQQEIKIQELQRILNEK